MAAGFLAPGRRVRGERTSPVQAAPCRHLAKQNCRGSSLGPGPLGGGDLLKGAWGQKGSLAQVQSCPTAGRSLLSEQTTGLLLLPLRRVLHEEQLWPQVPSQVLQHPLPAAAGEPCPPPRGWALTSVPPVFTGCPRRPSGPGLSKPGGARPLPAVLGSSPLPGAVPAGFYKALVFIFGGVVFRFTGELPRWCHFPSDDPSHLRVFLSTTGPSIP